MGVINNVVFGMWSWLPWLLGLGSLGWIVLALVAPGLLSVVSPLLRGLMEGLVEFVKVLYEGITDVLDSWKTVVTVIVLIAAFGNYWSFTETKKVLKERPGVSVKSKPTKPTTHGETALPFSWVR